MIDIISQWLFAVIITIAFLALMFNVFFVVSLIWFLIWVRLSIETDDKEEVRRDNEKDKS